MERKANGYSATGKVSMSFKIFTTSLSVVSCIQTPFHDYNTQPTADITMSQSLREAASKKFERFSLVGKGQETLNESL